jgi:CRISPR-associated endonuclease Cas1
MQNERIALPSPPAQIERVPVRDGVLVADGYGIKVIVRNGQLVVADGIGRDRRESRFSRATCGIKRVVVLGGTGYITLEAVRWLADIGACLVQVDRDGRLLGVSASSGRDDARLRRAQALAGTNAVGSDIARCLLKWKVEGQLRNLDRLNASDDVRAAISLALAALVSGTNAVELMATESAAAVAYWEAWSEVPVGFARTDQARVPDHWRTFGRRASPLTGNPRLAANPANAMLNYLYAILEAECRIACLTVGLDPGLGVLHADQRNRDSMALDIMEAIRPEVDRRVLDLLESHFFRMKDFHETRQGSCRVLVPLTHHLSGSAPALRASVGPIAEAVARMVVEEQGARTTVPTPITQQKRSAGRDAVRKRAARPVAARRPSLPNGCRSCGVVLAPGRLMCDECLPAVKKQALGEASTRANDRLAQLRAEGKDPAHGGEVARKRGATNAKHVAEARAFDRSADTRPDPETFRRDVLPGLQPVPVRKMAAATGLTRGYCSMIRRGLAVPHARHWAALRALVLTARVES